MYFIKDLENFGGLLLDSLYIARVMFAENLACLAAAVMPRGPEQKMMDVCLYRYVLWAKDGDERRHHSAPHQAIIYSNGKGFAPGYMMLERTDGFQCNGRYVMPPDAWKEAMDSLEETGRFERVFMVQEVQL